MVDLVKPSQLPPATQAFSDSAMIIDDGGVVRRATAEQVTNAGAPVASEAEALAGANNSARMTPLRVRQVLDNTSAPSVLRAQAWAESATPPDPTDPDSKSSKTWAGVAKGIVDQLGIVSGAWTPGVEGTTTPGTFTVSNRQGTFYRIGKMVFFQGFLDFNTFTGTGNILMTGLPYAARTVTAPGSYIVDIAVSAMTYPNTIGARITQASNKISIVTFGSGGNVTDLPVTSSGIIFVNGHYEAGQ